MIFIYRGTKIPRPPFCTLITEYPNHRLHTTDLAATQGASAGASDSDAMRLPNRSGAPPEAGGAAWNTAYAMKGSSIMIRTVAIPSRNRRYCQQCGTGRGRCSSSRVNGLPYIREVVSNRIYNLISDYGGHLFSTSGRYACGIKSAIIFKKEVFCISSKGFNQRDAYRVMLRKYPDVMNIEQMCDALRISTKTGYKLLHEGKFPAMKIGRSYRIPKAHLFTYLQICGQHCRAENSTVLIVLRRCVMLFMSTADRGRPKPKEVFIYGRRALSLSS